MDDHFQKWLMKAAVIVGAFVLMYFVFSPFQNCMRAAKGADKLQATGVCLELTKW